MNELTPEEVAMQLGITPQRVRAMIQAGRLRAVKKGRFYFVRPADVKKIVNRRPGRPRKARI